MRERLLQRLEKRACRRKYDQVGLYTFGCPCVGNAKFLEGFREKVPESLRVFQSIDSFAFLPRSTGFMPTTPAMSLVPAKDSEGADVIKLAFPDGVQKVTVLAGQKLPPQVCVRLFLACRVSTDLARKLSSWTSFFRIAVPARNRGHPSDGEVVLHACRLKANTLFRTQKSTTSGTGLLSRPS